MGVRFLSAQLLLQPGSFVYVWAFRGGGVDCLICKIFILLEVVRFMGKVDPLMLESGFPLTQH